MPNKASFAIELTADGGGVVRQEMERNAATAEQTADRTVKAYDRTGTAAERAAQKEKARIDDLKAQANALFAAANPPAPPASASPSPAATPAPRVDALVDQRRDQAMAQQLLETIRPAAAAQRLFNTELERADALMRKGFVSAQEYDAYVAKLKRDLADVRTFGPSTTSFAQARAAQQAGSQAIIDQINPAGRLQREHNDELAKAEALYRSGAISQAQYSAYQAKLKTDLAASTAALRDHNGVLGLNRIQYITAQSAVLRFGDMLMAGQSPIRAFGLEAHKLVEILSLDDDGMAGGMKKVTGFIRPMTVGLAAAAAALVTATAAGYQYNEQLNKMSAASSGFGRTSQLSGQQLVDLARGNASAGHTSVSGAEDTETAILKETRTNSAALEKAIQVAQKYADAMGVDAAHGNEMLAKSMADPTKWADELAEKYGYLTQKQVDEIHQLMEQNDLTGAQVAALNGLGIALDNAGDHVSGLTRNFRELKTVMSNLWNDIGANFTRAYDQLTNQENRAEKIERLKAEIAAGHNGINSLLGPAGEQQALAQARAELRQLMDEAKQEQQRQGASARNNQQGAEAARIAGKYGVDPSGGQKLEDLKKDLATLQQAQKAGQKVDADTLNALQHAVRTFMTPEQQRVAIAKATADLAKAVPHSQARADAARRLTDARTAGRVETDGAADAEANARGEAARGRASNAGAKHAETLARQAEAMNVAAAASLKLADAYLVSGDAALKAEAYRKAATDATKKGIDIDAQMARELNLMAAEQVANLAKTIRGSEDEVAARKRVIDMVQAGVIPARDMDQQLQQENALRPLLAVKAIAHGDALAKLTAEIDRYKVALAATIAQDRAWAAQQSINAANDSKRAADLRASLAGVTDPAERARRTATANDNAKGWAPGDVARDADAQARAAAAGQAADSAEWLANTRLQMTMQSDLLALQLQYSAVKNPDDQEEIRALQLKQELLQQHLVLSDQDVAALLDKQKNIKALTDQLQRQRQGYQDLRDTGANALGQLLSPDGIEHWGDTFKSVLRSVLTEIEKLAVINPLLNSVFGGNRATVGGSGGGLLGSLFGSIFGGGNTPSFSSLSSVLDTGSMTSTLSSLGSTLPSVTDLSSLMPAFADGTDSAPGGWSLVGEKGPEIVNLPRGAGVMTNKETRAAMQGGNQSGGDTLITINAQGAGPREIDALRLELRTFKAQVPSMAVSATSNARQRRVAA